MSVGAYALVAAMRIVFKWRLTGVDGSKSIYVRKKVCEYVG